MFDVDVREDRDELERKPAWQRLQLRKVAALDLGSNSFHLIIAALTGDERFHVIERARERVQIGESTFETGRIDPVSFERGLSALQRLRSIAQRHMPEAVLGIATSALRDADNGRQFLRAAIRATGVPVHIIDGLEEARLACLGARQSLVVAGRRLALFDVGGGSTEVVLSQGESCLLTASLELGTLRLRSMWGCQDPPIGADLIRLERRIALLVEPTLAHLRRLGFDRVALSCGAARALQRLAAGSALANARAVGAGSLQLESLMRLTQRLARMTEVERRELAGHEPTGVDTLLTGAVALRVILQGLGANEAVVASTGVREGLIADYVSKRGAAAAARVAI